MYLPLVISTRADSVVVPTSRVSRSGPDRGARPALETVQIKPPTSFLPLDPSRHVRRRHPPFARGRRGRRVPRVPRRGGSSPPQAPAESGARLASPPRGRGAAGAPPPRLRGGGEAAGTVQARARRQLLLPVQAPAPPECSAGRRRRRGTLVTVSRCAHLVSLSCSWGSPHCRRNRTVILAFRSSPGP